MREERGAVAGPIVVHEPYTLWGTAGGTVTVVEGGKFYLRGTILGDLAVEYGGRVHIYGSVAGNLKVARGAKVIVSGTIAGDATNEGGRLYVDTLGEIKGKVKTLKGETKLEPKAGVISTAEEEAAQAEAAAQAARAAELAAEAERITALLKGKAVQRVWQHRPEAMGIEFADGTKLYVEKRSDGLDVNIIGRAAAG
jgi:cytoskeletal protein CcmA (bactofilin family)